MIQTSPAVGAILAELSSAVRREQRRRSRRRKITRAVALAALALAALCTAALAATGAFTEIETVTPVGEVQLPHDVTIQAVDSFPEFVGRKTSSGFVTAAGSAKLGRFIYHVTGGEARDLGCGYPQVPTNNIYITSTRQLSEREILLLLEPDGELKPLTPAPPWITSLSNGCPNPGVAGQPATPHGELEPGKAAVATPTSASGHILIRKRVKVPLAGAPSPAHPEAQPTTPTGPPEQR